MTDVCEICGADTPDLLNMLYPCDCGCGGVRLDVCVHCYDRHYNGAQGKAER